VKVLTIAGSPSLVSRSTALLDAASQLLRRHGIVATRLAVRALPAEDLLHGRYASAALHAAQTKLHGAEAVIVATPVYKASFAGVLKAFLDLLPENAFADKVVLPLATSGSASHVLAVDYALKPVLSALGAKYVLNGVYAVDQQFSWAADGVLQIDADIAARLEDGVKRLIDSVNWGAASVATDATTDRAANAQVFSSARCSA
jgi:FMN reductase